MLFYITALVTACTLQPKNALPADYFLRVTDSVITQRYNYSDTSLHTLDSIFAANPSADLAARFKYYSYACGYYHQSRLNYTKALLYADSMLLLVHNNPGIKDREKLDAIANISKGDVLLSAKEYDGAYQYYYLGKLAAEKSLDACTYSEYSYRLGMVLYKKTSYTEAAVYFKKAFDESASCKNDFPVFFRRQELLSNAALSFNKSGQPDSAKLYFNKALDYIEANKKNYPDKLVNFETALGVVYGNLAQVYSLAEHEKAEALFKKSIAINIQPNHNAGDALITQVHLARLYFNLNNLPECFALLQQIAKGIDTLEYPHVNTGWSELMWKYYNAQNDTSNAYIWRLKYDSIKLAEDESNKKLNETDVTGQMKSLEDEYEMSLLKKDNKLNQAYLLVAAILFTTVGILLIFVLYNRGKSRKNIKALTALNNEISRQKEQLENTLGELETRNKEKDRILGIVAHDLRNPIAGISSLILMMKDGHTYTEDQLQLLALMQNACNNSMELINEILELAVKDKAIENAPDQLVDINQVTASCIKMLRFKAAEKNQKLQFTKSATPEIIFANSAKMWRVISNLITNAVKFSPQGATINITTSHNSTNVLVTVKDEGIGIPDEIRDKIFDVHTDAKRTGTNGEKPYGLGLSICKQIVEAYQGEIWFDTEVGKGTAFNIRVPRHTSQEEAI